LIEINAPINNRRILLPRMPAATQNPAPEIALLEHDMVRFSTPMVTAGAVLTALGPPAAWAQAPSDADRCAYGPHMMWWGGGSGGMIFGPPIIILALALAITVAVLLLRWVGGLGREEAPTGRTPPSRTPIDILEERFARGEIDKTEFEERRRVLGD
jgi:putative membrane protein